MYHDTKTNVHTPLFFNLNKVFLRKFDFLTLIDLELKMADYFAVESEPDKLGLCIQTRAYMDILSKHDLKLWMNELFDMLSLEEIRSLLFKGLVQSRNELSYNVIKSIKLKLLTINPNNYCIDNSYHCDYGNLFDLLPSHVISNKIFGFLDIKSLFMVERCNRLLSITAKMPNSCTNFSEYYENEYYRDNEDDIIMDRLYKNMMFKCPISPQFIDLNRYKFCKLLTVQLYPFEGEPPECLRKPNNDKYYALLNQFKYVKTLILNGPSRYDCNSINGCIPNYQFLDTIKFRRVSILDIGPGFLNSYSDNEFAKLSNNLKNISMVNCYWIWDESTKQQTACMRYYLDKIKILLLGYNNNVSYKSIEINEAHWEYDQSLDSNHDDDNRDCIDIIKESLPDILIRQTLWYNLKGFIYKYEYHCVPDGSPYTFDIFQLISIKIMNLVASKLHSLHLHCVRDIYFLNLWNFTNDYDNLYPNNNGYHIPLNIKELCLTINDSILSMKMVNKLTNIRLNLTKLNIVVVAPNTFLNAYTNGLLKFIEHVLYTSTKLVSLSFVFKFSCHGDDDLSCIDILSKIYSFLNRLRNLLIRIYQNNNSIKPNNDLRLIKIFIRSQHNEFVCDDFDASSYHDNIFTLFDTCLTIFPSCKTAFKIQDQSRSSEAFYYFATKLREKSNEFNMHVERKRQNAPLPSYLVLQLNNKNRIISHNYNPIKWDTSCEYCNTIPWIQTNESEHI